MYYAVSAGIPFLRMQSIVIRVGMQLRSSSEKPNYFGLNWSELAQ